MLINVMDFRERPYRWSKVLAVVQNAAEDATADDADPVPDMGGIVIDYAERECVSVREAFLWAERLDGMVTLQLYDHEPDAGEVSDD
ncbi:hypothetical protein GQ651_00760 [Alphaproteobacteria bacterium GH1-50]|uniref:Uncharacterized protein n=1 Tax=Kangsaoukella pontilimi TaxID=2691042 RepID=A0A7C9IQI1_9RHOB|nr:hypothetical protein [Kangsaoukella pontilimi]MXQ06366.1 hypothetical protein [Kangsaoukella pontilimi]